MNEQFGISVCCNCHEMYAVNVMISPICCNCHDLTC